MHSMEGAVAHRLIERAQLGAAPEVLAEVEQRMSTGQLHPSLFFAGAVARHVLGQHEQALATCTSGVAVASAHHGWRAALLSMRAAQRIRAADDGSGLSASTPDLDEVLRDLAVAEVALTEEVSDPDERSAARTTLALGYVELRLYELALPQFEAAYDVRDAGRVTPETPVVHQLNIAEVHLQWASELFRVGLDAQAESHCHDALVAAELAIERADGPAREQWQLAATTLKGCALVGVGDGADAAPVLEPAFARLVDHGLHDDRAFSAPFLALALARSGRRPDGLVVIEQAVRELPADADRQLAATTHHARLVMLARSGDEVAHAALGYGDILAVALWRQRARTLHVAQTLLGYERLRAEHDLMAQRSDRDPLTGTASRGAFDRARVDVQARVAAGGPPACVLVVDVDAFKRVNDSLGHLRGDVVLQRIASALLRAAREGDVVARFGGDEFVVLVNGDQDAGRQVARRMLTAVRGLSWADNDGGTTTSMGLAGTEVWGDLDATIEAADKAMYAVKRAGGDDLRVAVP